jgi:SAM-dependent methyltransferase
MQIAILGRQPKISIAELESLYGSDAITEINGYAATVNVDYSLPQERLGGSIKTAKFLTRLENCNLKDAFDYLQKTVPDHLDSLPEGKMQFGVSVYGFDTSARTILKNVLTLKKIIKSAGRSVRIIENKKPDLEAAQVLYNKLTGPLGWEILIIKDGSDCLLAQTTGVQNIDDYSKRDFDRPKRDSYVGMLPPKLAQIMINLAAGSRKPDDSRPPILLDAFCGTGVVLQEAMLMGYFVYGSDINEKMVRYSRDNLNWLQEQHRIRSQWNLEIADATSYSWRQPIDAVVSETYLGKPLTSLPAANKLEQIMNEANEIAERFLKNIAPQLKPDTKLCLALPAWHLTQGEFEHLGVLDHLSELGYNRLDLKHASWQDLIYYRKDQVVARELTILERI